MIIYQQMVIFFAAPYRKTQHHFYFVSLSSELHLRQDITQKALSRESI